MPGYQDILRELYALKEKISSLEIVGADVEQDEHNLRISISPTQSGTVLYWAKIKTVTDVNNYTADIYKARTIPPPEDEEPKKIRVWDIKDQLAVDDWIPVLPAVSPPLDSEKKPKYDYECCQQLGLIGSNIQEEEDD